jgi:hypothetical protein
MSPENLTERWNPYFFVISQENLGSIKLLKTLPVNGYGLSEVSDELLLTLNTVRLSYQKICEMGWVSGAEPQPYESIDFQWCPIRLRSGKTIY